MLDKVSYWIQQPFVTKWKIKLVQRPDQSWMVCGIWRATMERRCGPRRIPRFFLYPHWKIWIGHLGQDAFAGTNSFEGSDVVVLFDADEVENDAETEEDGEENAPESGKLGCKNSSRSKWNDSQADDAMPERELTYMFWNSHNSVHFWPI